MTDAEQPVGITGATGLVGKCLLANLRAQGRGPFRIFGRREPEALAPGDKFVEWDLLDRPSDEVTAAVAECSGGLWHLAACTRLLHRDERTILQQHQLNVGGTDAILRVLADFPKIPMFFISSSYARHSRSSNPYVLSKRESEHRVRAFRRRRGRAAVYRFGLVAGASSPLGPLASLLDGWGALFARAAIPWELPLPGAEALPIDPVEPVVRRIVEASRCGTLEADHSLGHSLPFATIADLLEQRFPGLQVRFRPGASEFQINALSARCWRWIAPLRLLLPPTEARQRGRVGL